MSKDGVTELSAELGKICTELGKAEGLKDATQFVRSAAAHAVPRFTGYLRSNIFQDVEVGKNVAVGTVYTNISYAKYVEFGTGPIGANNHEGISPEVTPAYRMTPWIIPESEIDVGVAEHYGWEPVETSKGRGYSCLGQPAKPFMYPALKDHEDEVLRRINDDIDRVLKKVLK